MAFEFDKAQAARFLQSLGYTKGETSNFRFFDSTGKAYSDNLHLSNGWAKGVQKRQDEGLNAYVVINKGGSNDGSIKDCVAVFCEWDDIEKSLQKDLWRTIGLPEPTIQVDTGGKSIHTYWVLEKPISPELWKPLQADLLDYADGDRKIKNPSRVMRLPGAWYLKDGQEPVRSELITLTENRYSYEDLRALIPRQERQEPTSWAQFDREFTFPILDAVPLYDCLAKRTRDSITKGVVDYRNNEGAAIARDLIGTADYLHSVGQRIDGDPMTLFYQYCQTCPQDKGWSQSEWELIWKSALNDNPGPSCNPEQIEACVKGVAWRLLREGNGPLPAKEPPKAEPEKEDVSSVFAEFEESENFYKKLVQELLTVKDVSKRDFFAKKISDRCRVPLGRVKADFAMYKEQARNTLKPVVTLKELFQEKQEDYEWVIPELIPRGDIVLLSSEPGTGKSLLAYEMAYQIVNGGSFIGNPVKKGKVLFIQLDERLRTYQRRLEDRGFDTEDTEHVRIMRKFKISQLELLEQQLSDFRPDLVIIDNLRKAVSGLNLDENKAEISEPINDLIVMLEEYDSACVLIHHDNKSSQAQGQNKISGSGSIAGLVFAAYRVVNPSTNKANPSRELRAVKMREGKARNYEFEINHEGTRWNYAFKGEANEDFTESSTIDRLVSVMAKNNHQEWFTTGEIRELLGLASNDKYIYTALNRASSKTLIQKKTEGKGKDKRIYYSLPCVCASNNDDSTRKTRNPVTKGVLLESSPQSSPSHHHKESGNVSTQNAIENPRGSSQDFSNQNNDDLGDHPHDDWVMTQGDDSTEPSHINTFSELGESDNSKTESSRAHTEVKPRGVAITQIGKPVKSTEYRDEKFSIGDRVDWVEKGSSFSKARYFEITRLGDSTAIIYPGMKEVPLKELRKVRQDFDEPIDYNLNSKFSIGDQVIVDYNGLKNAGYPIQQMIDGQIKELPDRGTVCEVTEISKPKGKDYILIHYTDGTHPFALWPEHLIKQ